VGEDRSSAGEDKAWTDTLDVVVLPCSLVGGNFVEGILVVGNFVGGSFVGGSFVVGSFVEDKEVVASRSLAVAVGEGLVADRQVWGVVQFSQ